jgi:hypothetical protein
MYVRHRDNLHVHGASQATIPELLCPATVVPAIEEQPCFDDDMIGGHEPLWMPMRLPNGGGPARHSYRLASTMDSGGALAQP